MVSICELLLNKNIVMVLSGTIRREMFFSRGLEKNTAETPGVSMLELED